MSSLTHEIALIKLVFPMNSESKLCGYIFFIKTYKVLIKLFSPSCDAIFVEFYFIFDIYFSCAAFYSSEENTNKICVWAYSKNLLVSKLVII